MLLTVTIEGSARVKTSAVCVLFHKQYVCPIVFLCVCVCVCVSNCLFLILRV